MLAVKNKQFNRIENLLKKSVSSSSKKADAIDYSNELDNIVKKIDTYTKKSKKRLLTKAFNFAFEVHHDHFRFSGEPYITHCIETALILTNLKMDPVTIAAGFLHDVVEDSDIKIEDVYSKFGREVGHLVDGVTKISSIKFKSHAEKQAEYFRKMIFSMSKDLRVILIKFADRLHNMRTIEHLPRKKAYRTAVETRDVYAPLAHRLGIAKIKWEFEDLAMKVINPDVYSELNNKVAERREKRESYIEKIVKPIKHELNKNNIKADVHGRAKSFYSIFKKMTKRNKSFEEIFDLLAIRIVVDKIDDCYFALGLVHTLFTPVHDRFKDYIATPKLNMYQSLHTTVIGLKGRRVEIQLRTRDMHKVAEFGIAAHWKYKENKKTVDSLDRYSTWLREIIDWHKDTIDPEEYLDILKTDFFISEVFVFTPKGDLLKLPIGVTPLDFAFSIHTDIGFHCIGAKVNGHIIPLNSKLKNGDSVEIITSSKSTPSRDWLTFVKTSKAKSKIKLWFKKAKYQEAVKLGEDIFRKLIRKSSLEYNKDLLKGLPKRLGKKNLEQVYKDIGFGNISLNKIESILFDRKDSDSQSKANKTIAKQLYAKKNNAVKGILVQGINNMMISFARCCHPVPGDSIIGYISKGRGVIVHRRGCINAAKNINMQDRRIEVSWDVSGEESFLIRLKVLSMYRRKFLKDIGDLLVNLGSNLLDINMSTADSLITAFLILDVNNLSHLSRLIRKLLKVDGVISVNRESGFNKTIIGKEK